MNRKAKCEHDPAEQETAVFADRLCPLCLTERVAELEASALTGYEDGWHKLRSERDELKADTSRINDQWQTSYDIMLSTITKRAEAAEAAYRDQCGVSDNWRIRAEAAEAKVEAARLCCRYGPASMDALKAANSVVIRADELQAELDS